MNWKAKVIRQIVISKNRRPSPLNNRQVVFIKEALKDKNQKPFRLVFSNTKRGFLGITAL